ncbi:MAG: hypothetical protein A3D52_02245 [Candidatus Taylorbacteria bacterium RIFCSPHIGHO2_02_FULL_44_36]|uniref:Uncharacterized protein n=1 Tax=Candidatus Taylorbacteria bacterium RIFCSPLOWO2_12_FULL_44_15c TaxID=1802333 RepID=A0A1G2P7S1_9BACT|nr:MAG: hypothetical protein A3D52_02245 [Candidatus Taylorbacteria bacterium RIFCSPHIGHO2_02_FULL_44_36]OHA38214.1 MAG: hypothetical protein A3I97_02165 [Candidatus Taylorbacteria bacterium RIFCSPLOWO2_02_FULL_44_35]OHA44404.1 MAG: hypothetical protein A3G03_01570 [Candidatus Taylorbacteria bacterium RIFCSPLOWO2_12_FULL_44_15c]
MEPNATQTSENRPAGPVIGAVIIILILVVGALYFWGAKLNKEANQTPEDILNTEDQTLNQLQTQGTTTDIDDINADLNATDLNNLDADLQNIDKELAN